MSTNRLTRDQVLNRALDLLDSPRLDEKCRGGNTGPSATITPDPNIATTWFQDGLDLAHILYPLQGDITTQTINITQGTTSYALNADYVQDVKDGLRLSKTDGTNPNLGRLRKRSLDYILDIATGGPPTSGQANTQKQPTLYTVQGGNLIIRPEPDKAYTGTFYYYKLPATITGGQIPTFPSDIILVDYVRVRGLEWLREEKPGTAQGYLQSALATLMKANIQQESELDQIGLDRDYFPGSRRAAQDGSDWTWMGPASVNP